eukprot:GDKI01042726.1.p1 GENE.GDKI01042726.1~~GDKI01042726.1.p1  ORF type:complete len:557 (-),score=198.43 GDKI01042726.1:539-2149(-)
MRAMPKRDEAQRASVAPVGKPESTLTPAQKQSQKMVVMRTVLATIGLNWTYGFYAVVFNTVGGTVAEGLQFCTDSEGVCDEVTWIWTLFACSYFITASVTTQFSEYFLRLGRRNCVVLLNLIYFVGAICEGFFPLYGPVRFILGRFIVGIATGMTGSVVGTYLDETVPADLKPLFANWPGIASGLGFVIAYSLGVFLDKSEFALGVWWRVMSSFPVLLNLVCACVVLFTCYETPHFLETAGRTEDAKTVIAVLHPGDAEHVNEKLEEVRANLSSAKEARAQYLNFYQIMSSRQYTHRVLAGIFVGVGGFVSGLVLFITSSNGIFTSSGVSSDKASHATIMIGLLWLIGSAAFPALSLGDLFGRRTILLTGNALQTVALMPAMIAHLANEERSKVTAGSTVFSVLFYITFYSFGYGAISMTWVNEAFPANMRKAVLSTADSCLYIIALINVTLYSLIPLSWVFLFLFLVNLGIFVFNCYFAHETAGGAGQEEWKPILVHEMRLEDETVGNQPNIDAVELGKKANFDADDNDDTETTL